MYTGFSFASQEWDTARKGVDVLSRVREQASDRQSGTGTPRLKVWTWGGMARFLVLAYQSFEQLPQRQYHVIKIPYRFVHDLANRGDLRNSTSRLTPEGEACIEVSFEVQLRIPFMSTERPITTDGSRSSPSLKGVRITRYAGLEWALSTMVSVASGFCPPQSLVVVVYR